MSADTKNEFPQLGSSYHYRRQFPSKSKFSPLIMHILRVVLSLAPQDVRNCEKKLREFWEKKEGKGRLTQTKSKGTSDQQVLEIEGVSLRENSKEL